MPRKLENCWDKERYFYFMKILQIGSHCEQGGAARVMNCIHKELLRQGQESYVAYGRGKKATEANVYKIDTVPEVYLSALFSRVVGLNGWGNWLATKRLIRLIEKIKPDVIHMHALHGYYLNFPMLFKYINKKGIRWVWTFHDCHAFVGNCGYFYDCDKWKSGCGNCPYLRQYPTSQFLDFTKFMWEQKKALFNQSKNGIIVTPSDWLTGEARKSFMGVYPCKTIHNGVDANKTFYPRNKVECRSKYGFSNDDKIVLGIASGYSEPRKGAKYIIEMARELENEVKVVLIGWEEKNNEMLKGCKNIITISRTRNLYMLAEYYSLADVFVLPSLAENYATVSLESMACGTPVVGFNTGGVPEQLSGKKGIAVKLADSKAFTDAVRFAVSDQNDLLRGDELAKIIKEENSIERMVAEYIATYEGGFRDAI